MFSFLLESDLSDLVIWDLCRYLDEILPGSFTVDVCSKLQRPSDRNLCIFSGIIALQWSENQNIKQKQSIGNAVPAYQEHLYTGASWSYMGLIYQRWHICDSFNFKVRQAYCSKSKSWRAHKSKCNPRVEKYCASTKAVLKGRLLDHSSHESKQSTTIFGVL